jgi:protein ImuB
MWFPRLASDRILRALPLEGPFAVVLREGNANRLYCLNPAAERVGLHRGMALADAQAFCPDLMTRPADLAADARFVQALRRWATRYCPWVGVEGRDGLVLDITGAAHLWGDETGMLTDMHQRLSRAGVFVRLGLADTRGAAWALARHGEGRAEPGAARAILALLPVAALRLDDATVTALQRLGLRSIGDLEGAARAPLARRFGPGLMQRLDQALGRQPESVTPERDPPHYGVRLSLPEPVGLTADVMAGVERLLIGLCERLRARDTGARVLCLTLRRVDQGAQQIELRLARALRDPARILPLFVRGVDAVDAGFGIDQMRLEATLTEALPALQPGLAPPAAQAGRLDDLITRIGTRIGLENVQRFLPADSHIPENSFLRAPAAYAPHGGAWVALRPRPLRLFPPEPVAGGTGARPPERFRWRRMALAIAQATGPERIAPEWWLADENWRSGIRDYWHVQTRQGRRLWLFYTPQNPGWFVQGEFA